MAEDLATIASSGADYTSLSGCEAGEQKDYVTATNNGVWRYTEAIDDTTAVTIDGSTTSATYDIKIECAAGVGHAGVWSTSKQRLRDNTAQAILLSDNYVTIEGLQIEQYSTTASDEGIRITSGATGVYIRNCLIRAATATSEQDGVYFGNWAITSVYLHNTVIYGFNRAGIHLQNYSGSSTQTVYARNCTIYGNGTYGVRLSATDAGGTCNFDVDNSLVLSNSTDFSETAGGGSENWGGDYNIDSDGTGSSLGLTNHLSSRTATANASPGAGDWVIFTNITAGSEDFHLQSSAENDAEGYGADLSGQFSDDFEGDTRSDWDAGADEIVAGALTGASVDGAAFGDTPTIAATFFATSADGLSADDTPTVAATFFSTGSDGVTVDDTPVSLGTFLAASSDGSAFEDSSSVVLTLVAQGTDGVAFDDATLALATLLGLSAEDIVFDDTSAGNTAGTLTGVVTDGVAMGDTIAKVMTFYVASADGVTVNDLATALATLLVASTDGVALSDVTVETSTVAQGVLSITVTAAGASITATVTTPGMSVSGTGPSMSVS